MQLILHEADILGVHWKLVNDSDVVCFTYKEKTLFIRNHTPCTTHSPGSKICANKASTKAFLKRAGIQVSNGFTINRQDDDIYLEKVWNALTKPVVVKPTHGTHGDSVFMGINSLEDFLSHIHTYFSHSKLEGGLLAEETFYGKEYRIQMTREKLLAVIERVPAFVTGDGTHTIEELIEKKNQSPMRNIAEDVYPQIKIDEEVTKNLQDQGKEATSVLDVHEHIYLRKISNVMAGGETIDRTDEIHPSVKKIALRAIQSIPGLSWGGIDFMTTDLYKEQNDNTYQIIEVNAAPEFDMHDLPMQGKSRNVAREFLYLIFPELEKAP